MANSVQEYRSQMVRLMEQIDRPVKLMEVCGTHTMAAFRSGLRSLLPEGLSLLSGPGCPVCVTPNQYIDHAIAIAQQSNVMVATFGDMVRVPGTESSLETVRAQTGKVQVVYSPLDALERAKTNPKEQVVFLGVGFETTAPAIAWTLAEAARKRIGNYKVLCAHKTIPPAMAALLASGDVQIDGFLCPGHVSVVIGADVYQFVCRDFHVPCVVAGFEPMDMMAAITMLLAQIAEGRANVKIQYSRSVSPSGNREAQSVIDQVFEACDSEWRGLGTIPNSGLRIRESYKQCDAGLAFSELDLPTSVESPGCICGEILKGTKAPNQCSLFRKKCTPSTPVGACMVSSEGTCAAYFKYAKTHAVEAG